MRFLLYNIRYGCGGRPGRTLGFFRRTHAHLEDITAFIQSLNPDLIGLVEVDAGSYRSRRRNQAQVIADSLGHFHTYRSKYGVASRAHRIPVRSRQGNAILARGDPTQVKFHYFTRGVKRLVIELEMKQLVVFLVHLSLGARVRHRQLTDLYTLVKRTKKPLIVAGDFNTLWGEHEVKLFLGATGLVSADPDNLPSYPSWRPKRHLDFILHSPQIRVTGFHMPQVTLSDHLPLVCDFEIVPPTKA